MDTFYRTDILQALLQHTGADMADITAMLAALQEQASTAAAFRAWNLPLDLRGAKLFRQLLDRPSKAILAACAQAVHAELLGRFDTSPGGQRLLDALRSLF